MTVIEQAKAAIREAELPEELQQLVKKKLGRSGFETLRAIYSAELGKPLGEHQVAAATLADNFHYVIALETTRIVDEVAAPLGGSKYRGLPHLPPDIAWPAGHYFAAQLDLDLLHPHDLHRVLPESGLLYLFYDAADGGYAIHHDGPRDTLRPAPYPPAESLPAAKHYLEAFLEARALVQLVPQYVIDFGGSQDLEQVTALLPQPLTDRLDALLGCPISAWFPSLRMFGPPLCWQGEEELLFGDEAGEGDAAGEADTEPVRQLIFQDDFGEGNIHFWLDVPRLPAGETTRLRVTYSGT